MDANCAIHLFSFPVRFYVVRIIDSQNTNGNRMYLRTNPARQNIDYADLIRSLPHNVTGPIDVGVFLFEFFQLFFDFRFRFAGLQPFR